MTKIRVARTVEIPDALRISRYRKIPELGPRILFFSGGSALNGLCKTLKGYTHNSIHLVTPFDSGGSSAELRRAFDMPSMGDLRSRLMALADESVLGHPEVYELFTYRLPKNLNNDDLRARLEAMALGKSERVANVPNPMRRLIRNQLGYFLDAMPQSFDLRGASIGNLILVGGYLNNHHHLDPIIYLFSKLVEVRGVVRPISDEYMHLAAELEDGRVLRRFFQRTGQALHQDWLVNMVKGIMRHLPVSMLAKMGLATLVAPKTRGWAGAREAIEEYVEEQEQERREALGLDGLVQAAANVPLCLDSANPAALRAGLELVRQPPMINSVSGEKPRIEDMLKARQTILCQVTKNPIAHKGARLTTHITLPGRFLVFMPTVVQLGVSRRITDDQERARLKTIIETFGGGGWILRTAGEGQGQIELEAAVRGMLPRKPLGRAMMKKLRIFAGPEHTHQAQQPKPLEI